MKSQEAPTLRQLQEELVQLRAKNEQVLRQSQVIRLETSKLSLRILEATDQRQVTR